MAPGEVEEGEGEVEKLSIPVASGLHIVLAIKPPGIKLKWNEYKRNELWVTPSHKINLSGSSLPTVVELDHATPGSLVPRPVFFFLNGPGNDAKIRKGLHITFSAKINRPLSEQDP